MPDGGNAEATRVVAEQLFDTWQARQAVENKRRSLIVGSLPAWIACALSVIAVLWQAAITTQRVNENTRRIDVVEVDLRDKTREDKAVTSQLATIEAKLDIILGERG